MDIDIDSISIDTPIDIMVYFQGKLTIVKLWLVWQHYMQLLSK